MKNKTASASAVDEFCDYFQGSDVIALATQEESAKDGHRLYQKVLAKLNKDEPGLYKLVETSEPQFQHTTAGGQFLGKNHVRTAILIKKGYSLSNAKAVIIEDPDSAINAKRAKSGKNISGRNKVTITISGKLRGPKIGSSELALSVTGGHLDSKSDEQRRNHINLFFQDTRLKTLSAKSLDDIYSEAKQFSILMADFNERDKYMKNGDVQDFSDSTNIGAYGFDISQRPRPRAFTLPDGTSITIDSTYGCHLDQSGKQIIKPDPRAKQGRFHDASSGCLDRVTYNSGLAIDTVVDKRDYRIFLNPKEFYNKKIGKSEPHSRSVMLPETSTETAHHFRSYGSDHIPVVRTLDVDTMSLQPMYKSKLIGDYISRRLPNYRDKITQHNRLVKELESYRQSLKDEHGNIPDKINSNDPNLISIINQIRYHDDTSEPLQFFQAYCNVSSDETSLSQVIIALQTKRLRYEAMAESIVAIQERIESIKIEDPHLQNAKNQILLEHLYNSITLCNELNNAKTGCLYKAFLPQKRSLLKFKHSSTDKYELYRILDKTMEDIFISTLSNFEKGDLSLVSTHNLFHLSQLKSKGHPIIQESKPIQECLDKMEMYYKSLASVSASNSSSNEDSPLPDELSERLDAFHNSHKKYYCHYAADANYDDKLLGLANSYPTNLAAKENELSLPPIEETTYQNALDSLEKTFQIANQYSGTDKATQYAQEQLTANFETGSDRLEHYKKIYRLNFQPLDKFSIDKSTGIISKDNKQLLQSIRTPEKIQVKLLSKEDNDIQDYVKGFMELTLNIFEQHGVKPPNQTIIIKLSSRPEAALAIFQASIHAGIIPTISIPTIEAIANTPKIAQWFKDNKNTLMTKYPNLSSLEMLDLSNANQLKIFITEYITEATEMTQQKFKSSKKLDTSTD